MVTPLGFVGTVQGLEVFLVWSNLPLAVKGLIPVDTMTTFCHYQVSTFLGGTITIKLPTPVLTSLST